MRVDKINYLNTKIAKTNFKGANRPDGAGGIIIDPFIPTIEHVKNTGTAVATAKTATALKPVLLTVGKYAAGYVAVMGFGVLCAYLADKIFGSKKSDSEDSEYKEHEEYDPWDPIAHP